MDRRAYHRAEELMPWHMDDCVPDGHPAVQWLSDTAFWYTKESFKKETEELLEKGCGAEEFMHGSIRREFRLCDAASGTEKVLFDPDAVSACLGKKDTSFTSIRLENEKIFFTEDGKDYEYDPQSGSLKEKGVHKQQTAAVSPDGTMEIFVKDYDLYLRKLKNGEEIRLTFDGEKDFAYGAEAEQINVVRERLAGIAPETGVLWSHDSSRFLTYRLDMRGVKELYILRSFDQSGRESIRPELISYKCSLPEDDRTPMAYFYLGDIAEGTVRKVDGPPVTAGHFVLNKAYEMAQWLEDDSCVYYTSTSRGDKDGYFHIIDAETGAVWTVVHEHSDEFLNLGTYGRYDGFGAYPYSNFLTADKRWVFWQSEREDFARIYRYDAVTGELLNPVTPKDSMAGVLIKKDEENQWLYYMASCIPGAEDPYYHYFCRVHFDGTGFEILTPENAEHAVCAGDKYFTDTYSRVDQPPVTVLRTLDGKLVRTLSRADTRLLYAKGYQTPVPFTVMASDEKTTLYGIVIPPADFEEGREYPVIDYIYGGMQCCNVPKEFTWKCFGGRESFGGLQSFAQLGFAGIILDGLGTPGRGKTLHNISYENIHGCAGLKDHVWVLDQLKKQFPYLDTGRMGIWGNSGGGCATSRAMLEYPDIYKVGVSSAGNHDQRMYDNMWTERYYGLYKPEIYKKGDNTALAENLKGKLLIVHGAMDCNVSMSESLRLVDALIRADKDFDFLILPRTNHNVPGNPYFIRRKLDYFVRHLLKEEIPEDYHFSADNLMDRTFAV